MSDYSFTGGPMVTLGVVFHHPVDICGVIVEAKTGVGSNITDVTLVMNIFQQEGNIKQGEISFPFRIG